MAKRTRDFTKVSASYSHRGYKSRLEMDVHNRALKVADKILEHKKYDILCALQLCESPIEQLLRVTIEKRLEVIKNRLGLHGLEVSNQAKIGSYRVDFLFTNYEVTEDRRIVTNVALVVECDGHDFHEKTKEQAARDKARDRYLQKKGYTVLRFTGSEIWKDPDQCANEIFEMIQTQLERKFEME